MKSVLLIDDDDDIREVMTFVLESNGFKVMSSSDAITGIHLLEKLGPKDYPGLIIVDYLMPEMTGVTFIQTIREKFPESLAKIPVAISSAMGPMDENILELKDVIKMFKPLDLDDLLRVARSHCS